MILAVQLATLAVGAASCPANLANDLAKPATAASQQLITVEAATDRATYATARTWTRVEGCWVPAGGPYTARVGRNGVRRNKREGDGATPAGTFAIGGKMYGNSPSPGVSYPQCSSALRRLVGRGFEVAHIQHVPTCRLWTPAAVQGDDA